MITYVVIAFIFAVTLGSAASVIRRPVRAFAVFAFLLAPHSLIIALLYKFGSVSIETAKAVSAWKEIALLVAALVSLTTMSLNVRWDRLRVPYHGVVMTAWIVLLLIHFVVSSNGSVSQKLFGVRDWLIYLLPFLVGYASLRRVSDLEQVFKVLIVLGALVSAIGLIEVAFVPITWHVLLGVPEYFRDLLGQIYPAHLFYLPPNYWVVVGGQLVRRSVSVFLSGQGHAIVYLLFVPVSVTAYLYGRSRKLAGAALLCLAGILSSLTRMTIVVSLVQVMLILFLMRRSRWLNTVIALVVICFSVAFTVNQPFRDFLVDTVTFSDMSSRNRPNLVTSGIAELFKNPFGSGVGRSGFTASRFSGDAEGGGSAAGEEMGYRKITDSLGFPGLLLWFSWFALIIYSSYKVARRSTGLLRYMSIAVVVIAIGFMLNNLTAPPDQVPVVVYLFHWLAGGVVYQYVHPVMRDRTETAV